jgi:hypothetical protein
MPEEYAAAAQASPPGTLPRGGNCEPPRWNPARKSMLYIWMHIDTALTLTIRTKEASNAAAETFVEPPISQISRNLRSLIRRATG